MPMIFTKTDDFNDSYDEIFGDELDKKCENLSKIMRMIGWKWTHAKNEYPSAEEIRATIFKLYHHMILGFENADVEELANANGTFIAGCGGLTFTLYFNVKKRTIDDLTLIFDIWDYEAC